MGIYNHHPGGEHLVAYRGVGDCPIGMEMHVRNGCGVHNIAPVFQMEIIRLIQVAKEFAVRIADGLYLAVECGRHLLLAAVDQQVFTAGLHLFRNPLMQFFRR